MRSEINKKKPEGNIKASLVKIKGTATFLYQNSLFSFEITYTHKKSPHQRGFYNLKMSDSKELLTFHFF